MREVENDKSFPFLELQHWLLFFFFFSAVVLAQKSEPQIIGGF